MTGIELSRNVLKRFLMVSMLSSVRPSLRPSKRWVMTSSGQSKNKTKSQSYPAVVSQASRFSLFLGKPSIKNRSFPLSRMASSSKLTVTSLGTICPCLIISATMLPSLLPLFMCARSKSPADRCTNSKSRTTFAHCVPLPAPGPPSTNTTVGVASEPIVGDLTPSLATPPLLSPAPMHATDVADVASAALANVVVANVAIFTIRPARGTDADATPSHASIIAVFTAALSCASSSLVSLPSRSRRHHIDRTHGFDRVASHRIASTVVGAHRSRSRVPSRVRSFERSLAPIARARATPRVSPTCRSRARLWGPTAEDVVSSRHSRARDAMASEAARASSARARSHARASCSTAGRRGRGASTVTRARGKGTASGGSDGREDEGRDGQDWMAPIEGFVRRASSLVTVYQAPAPPTVTPTSKLDALEAVVRWHLGGETSATLVMKEVRDVIVNEVTSFPADKLVVGETPSVAMHVPVPALRATNRFPTSAKALAAGRSVDNPGSESAVMPVELPVWDRWSQPTTAMTLRTILMATSALAAAAGMRIGTGAGEDSAAKSKVYVLLPDSPQLGDLRTTFERLWPNNPYEFVKYSRDGLWEDFASDVCAPRRKGHKKLVLLVNISAPGDEEATESDGEAMVSTVELLLEKGVAFVQLTLWLDSSLAISVTSGRPRTSEKDRLKTLMEGRTKILLGRSVKRVEARKNVLRAFEAAQADPQGRALVVLEEMVNEARLLGAMSDEGEKLMRDVRGKASAAEELALANALRAACLQVPMDIQALQATYARAEQFLANSDYAEDVRASVDDDLDESEDDAAASMSYDPDPFAAAIESVSSGDDSKKKKNARSALTAAVIGAERALRAATFEGELRAALADDSSRSVEAVPRLEALLIHAAKLASNGPPLTQEGAAKLNTLVSRVQSRATALQNMDNARAALIEAMTPSVDGVDRAVGGITSEDVKVLEDALTQARSSAWPWQLDELIDKAESVLVRWRRLERLETAILSRSKTELRLAIEESQQDSDSSDVDMRRAKTVLSELEAESALEGGDQRLRAYFAASKVAWATGTVTPESAQMLLTLRESLDITQAEHEQIQRMANAASGAVKPSKTNAPKVSNTVSKQRSVQFSGRSDGVRAPMFESAEVDIVSNVDESEDMETNEAKVAWANAVPDEDGVGEMTTDSSEATSGWRRVGESIIYNEEEVIGVGSAGTYVFRGYVRHTSRARHAVAVKRIARPPGEKGRDLVQLVEREVELMTALNQSPLVPFFHCWGITSSNVFIAQELCPESLREHIARQPNLTANKRIKLLRGIAEGISWLHDDEKPQGCITHNDLKPENLLVTSNGQVKIADVGLGVCLRKEEGDIDQYSLGTFNKYGVSIVLAGRAPEIIAGRPLTPAADIWAMGVVFFYVLTGFNSPFGEDPRVKPSDDEILNGRYNLQRLMSVNSLPPRRAIEARHLLAAMLSPNPASRPAAWGILNHPLLWDDSTALEKLSALHANSAKMQTGLTSVLQSVNTKALLGGDSERGALLAAVSMDLQDWQSQMEPALIARVCNFAQRNTNGTSGAKSHQPKVSETSIKPMKMQGENNTKPYGSGFADLLRFCRNVYEHPPETNKELSPIVQKLLASADGDESQLPFGVTVETPVRRLSRDQRRAIFAAYVTLTFPGLPLAVYECAQACAQTIQKTPSKTIPRNEQDRE